MRNCWRHTLRLALGALAAAGGLGTRPLLAQRASDTAVAALPDSGAPVVYAGDTLFRLYGTLGAFTPRERAAAVVARLRLVEHSVANGTDSISVVDGEAFSELLVDDAVLMTVLDADALPLGRARPAVARQYAAVLRGTLVSAAERMSTRALLRDGILALAATAILVALLWLMRWGFPRVYQRIERLRQVRLPALRIQQFELLSAGRLSSLLLGAARVARVIVTLLLLYVYVPLVLSFFPWTAPLSSRIVGYAIRPFAAAGRAFVAYLPNMFYLAAGVIIVRYVLAFLHRIFQALGDGTITFRGFYRDWAEPTYKIVRVLVIVFAVTALYPFLPGATSDAFKGVSIFLGVLFSLGSSSAVGNVVAGVVLTYTRAFQIGDRVRIGETVGDVTEKTLLVTRVRTIKNVAVTIPNGTVLSSQVLNYTTLAAGGGLILNTSVTIGYDAPWQRVYELLIDAARRTPHILAEPAPFVLQTGLGDFSVSYEINAFTDRPEIMAVTYSHLHENIQETFNAAGVEILSPHYQALRDGNQATIPPERLAADYRAPAFRVQEVAHASNGEPSPPASAAPAGGR